MTKIKYLFLAIFWVLILAIWFIPNGLLFRDVTQKQWQCDKMCFDSIDSSGYPCECDWYIEYAKSKYVTYMLIISLSSLFIYYIFILTENKKR